MAVKYRRIRLGQIGNSKVVDFAVQELIRYLKRMDSQLVIDILQSYELKEEYENIIWIGLDKKLTPMVVKVEDTSVDDAITVAVKDGSGYITGSNERSVLLATYRFLKALGCEWVRPGAEGERIPKRILERETINVTISEKASYRHRGVCIEGANTYENVVDMIDYLPKVGMNEYFVQFMVPGIFFERWYLHEGNSYFEAEEISREQIQDMVLGLEKEIAKRGLSYHKTGHGWTCEPFGIDGTGWDAKREYPLKEETRKYLAEVNGKRELWGNVPLNTNLCYSNPEVREKMTEAIVKYCQENQHVNVLHFWLADASNNHCECETCVQKRPADWYVMLLNELDEKLTTAGLDTKIVFLLYMDLLWEPVVGKLRNQERFIMMFAPITRNYGQNYGDYIDYEGDLPPYVRNKLEVPDSLAQNLEQLRRWQKGFAGDSFDFDYHLMWAHLNDPGYEYCARNLFEDMKDLHKIGLDGMVSCQVQRCFFPTALPFNMMAAALWDENCDYEQKVLEYYNAAFGEEGKSVHAYLKIISDMILLYEGPAHGKNARVTGTLCKDYVMLRKEITDFQKVIERNAEHENMWQEEWRNLQLHSSYVTLVLNALELQEQGKTEEARATIDEMLNMLERNEIRVQKVLDVHNARVQWKQRI